ncbi:MAG: hypothetical protein ABIH23_33595 [bacterium]
MTNHDEFPIDTLLRKTMGEQVPPEVESHLRERLVALQERMDSLETAQRPAWHSVLLSYRLAWAGGAGCVIFCLALAAFFVFRTPGMSVYAAAMEALKDVRTLHVTGWTTSPRITHSTVFDEPLDESRRYPVEIWEWFTESGEYRKYERQGPIVEWDDGGRLYQYQEHHNRLFIDKSAGNTVGSGFQGFAEQLRNLKERGVRKTDLGERRINGRLAKGIRLEKTQTKRGEYWIDTETDLPIQLANYKWQDREWTQRTQISVGYDDEVPASISAYSPPETEEVHYAWSIDPRFEKWNQRLRRLAAVYRERPLPEKMEIVPRESDEEFSAYTYGKMPGIKGYGVWPIQATLEHFLQGNYWEDIPRGALRLPRELSGIQLNFDLVVKHGVSQREQLDYVLDSLGLELVETMEERDVWVAHYDGRPLKPWREVKAPISSEGARATQPGMAITWGRLSMRNLFNSFAHWQDVDLTAKKLIIIDETGLPTGKPDDESAAVSSEDPYWGGEKSIEIARRWFKEEFGVTFAEEKRLMKVYLISRR